MSFRKWQWTRLKALIETTGVKSTVKEKEGFVSEIDRLTRKIYLQSILPVMVKSN